MKTVLWARYSRCPLCLVQCQSSSVQLCGCLPLSLDFQVTLRLIAILTSPIWGCWLLKHCYCWLHSFQQLSILKCFALYMSQRVCCLKMFSHLLKPHGLLWQEKYENILFLRKQADSVWEWLLMVIGILGSYNGIFSPWKNRSIALRQNLYLHKWF